jgi:2-iminoacetate synthase ThiH
MREKHLFELPADKIAAGAKAEAEYHRKREAYWKEEYAASLEIVKNTASLEVKEVSVTGGVRAQVSVKYGDPAAYSRMDEAFGKIARHREAAERFETDAKTYGTQGGRMYELDTADVHYYRLGGGPREE